MPVYVWECPKCHNGRETVASIAERNRQEVCKCRTLMQRVITPARVSPDISPYIAVAGDMAGKPITSRKQHREFLKRNRFTEVGNEPIRPIKNDFTPRRGEVAEELKRVIPQVMQRH